MKQRRSSTRCESKHRARPGCGTRQRQRAASLIEALCVVALLLILTTLYWGSGSESRQQQRLRACQHNLSGMFMGLQIYANDQRGLFPAMRKSERSEEPLALLVPRWTVDTSVFLCPAGKDPPLPQGQPFTTRTISYAYYMGRRGIDTPEVLVTDRQVDTQPKYPGQLLFSADGRAPGNNHGSAGGNLLFADGHTESSVAQARASLVLTQGVVLLNP
jgi:prepilin-type processing-associated H-X9-DG protein